MEASLEAQRICKGGGRGAEEPGSGRSEQPGVIGLQPVVVFSAVNHDCSRCGRVRQGVRKGLDVRNALSGKETPSQR